MIADAAAILALISDLYSTIAAKDQRIAELEARIAELEKPAAAG